MFVIYFDSKWLCIKVLQPFAKSDLRIWGATLSYNVNLNESFTFFFPRLCRQNLILGLSPTIFSVNLAVLGKIGWDVELMERDQDNR